MSVGISSTPPLLLEPVLGKHCSSVFPLGLALSLCGVQRSTPFRSSALVRGILDKPIPHDIACLLGAVLPPQPAHDKDALACAHYRNDS